MIEWRDPPPEDPWNHHRKTTPAEQEAIADAYTHTTDTLDAIARRFGVSRQRVHQFVRRYYDLNEVQDRRRALMKDPQHRDSLAYADELLEMVVTLDPCEVCGGPNYRLADQLLRGRAGRHHATCSHPCAKMWQAHRTAVLYRTNPAQRELHRYRIALSYLKHPEKYPDSRVAWATKVKEGYERGEPLPRNRTFTNRNARINDPYFDKMLHDRGVET